MSERAIPGSDTGPWDHRPGHLPLEPGEHPKAIYVYQWPLRLWHWIMMSCIVVLAITGYLIGAPPPSLGGEAWNTFVFGYIRMAHFIAGQILVVTFIARIWMVIFGNHHGRAIFWLPFLDMRYWKNVIDQALYYLFLKEGKTYIGHNPLANTAMFFSFTLPMFLMIVTGMALYSEGIGIDSWQYALFGWVFTLFGNSFVVHTVHHLGMYAIGIFALIHVYMVFREDTMGDTTIVSTMVNGWRFFKPRERR
jgi:Ni/Fe-hydrogenase 1 B-type cytochrome subunit